ncbi:MAG: hypothetical protein LBN95_08760 [Prevotellaceae bacterium]|jgi:hypothetical protein|nr:hypothetical protein [Prevotellaceae bacterium]
MKKRFFFSAALMVIGLSCAQAQIRIGGDEEPNSSAVLDLNPDNQVLQGNSVKGLALPRVRLSATFVPAPLAEHIKGMVVFNTAAVNDVKEGVYFNDGSRWISVEKLNSDSVIGIVAQSLKNAVLRDSVVKIVRQSELDGVVGNEVVNATSNGGLVRSGAGTAASPYTLGIANGGVTTARIAENAVTTTQIADGTITAADLGDMGAASGQILKYNGISWLPQTLYCSPTVITSATNISLGIMSARAYTAIYSWTNLSAGFYSLRLKMGGTNTLAKFILQSSAAFGTSIPFEVNEELYDAGGDGTVEIMFHITQVRTNLTLKAKIPFSLTASLSNLYLARF